MLNRIAKAIDEWFERERKYREQSMTEVPMSPQTCERITENELDRCRDLARISENELDRVAIAAPTPIEPDVTEQLVRVRHEVVMIRMAADYTGLSAKTHAWVSMDLLESIDDTLAALTPIANREAELSIYRDRAETFGKACAEKDTQIAELEATLAEILPFAEQCRDECVGGECHPSIECFAAVTKARALLAAKESEK